MICTRFSEHWTKIESLGFHHGCLPELGGRHPFCFRSDSAVIVIVDILIDSFGKRFEGRILLLKSIEHFVFQPAEESIHNTVVIAFVPRKIKLRYVRCPLLQRLLGTKISIDNVVSNFPDIAFVGMILFLGTFAKLCKLVHNPLGAFVIHPKATVHKLMEHPPYAVSFPVLIEDGGNFRR